MTDRVILAVCPTCTYARVKGGLFEKIMALLNRDKKSLAFTPTCIRLGSDGQVEAFEEDGAFHVHIVTTVA